MARPVLAVLLALLVAAPVGGALTLPAASDDAPKRLILDLRALAQDQHAPVIAASTGIGPGSPLFMDFGDGLGFAWACTANFVWRSSTGKLYLGAAGHCFLPPDKTSTHGPDADYNAANTKVIVCTGGCNFGGQTGFILSGTTRALGPVAYARQTLDGVDVGNDFGLVEIPASLPSQVRPSMPVWGGPTSATPESADGPLCHYGNGVAVGEVFPTKARAGLGLGSFDDGSWQAALASEVGDSGSAVVTCDTHGGGVHGMQPIGLITHGIGAIVATVPGIAFGTTTERAIEMAREANLQVSVVPGA